MNDKVTCLDHTNGFEHFVGQLGGLEEEFDLGIKFEERDPDEYSIDQTTGVKVWPEPVLSLYVSVKQVPAFHRSPVTLHYGLTRSRFSGGPTSNEADRQRLLELAIPLLISDLRLLKSGEKPTSLTKTKMV